MAGAEAKTGHRISASYDINATNTIPLNGILNESLRPMIDFLHPLTAARMLSIFDPVGGAGGASQRGPER